MQGRVGEDQGDEGVGQRRGGIGRELVLEKKRMEHTEMSGVGRKAEEIKWEEWLEQENVK